MTGTEDSWSRGFLVKKPEAMNEHMLLLSSFSHLDCLDPVREGHHLSYTR